MSYTTIFHIDDDHDDIYFFAAAIEHLSGSAKCFSFANAAKALHTLQSFEILPDTIFLDLNMPIINGQEFLSELKATKGLGAIPAIILSTSEDPDAQQQLRAEVARVFLTKPSDVKDLVELLRPYFSLSSIPNEPLNYADRLNPTHKAGQTGPKQLHHYIRH